MPREAGDGAILEALAYEDEPFEKRESTFDRLLLSQREGAVKESERRDDPDFGEPEHPLDLRREVERADFFRELRKPVEIHDFERCVELRQEEIPRGGVLLDR